MNVERTYSVYMHIFPNGKGYIGMTSSNPVEKRWGSNGCKYQGQSLYPDILKYGWENIDHEIVFRDISLSEAEEKERELICKYNTTNTECGYNIAHGGIHGTKILNESTKEKLRQWDLAHPEVAERMRWYARHKSSETIEKIREKATGVKQSAEIIAKRASKLSGRKRTPESIEKMRMIQRNRTWEDKRVEASLAACEKTVLQYSPSGNFIQRYESATKAARAVNGAFGSVSRCCRGERRTYKGYMWRYE